MINGIDKEAEKEETAHEKDSEAQAGEETKL